MLRYSAFVASILTLAVLVGSCGEPTGVGPAPPVAELPQAQVAVALDPLMAPRGVESLRAESSAGSVRLSTSGSAITIDLIEGLRSVWVLDDDDELVAVVSVFIGREEAAEAAAPSFHLRDPQGVERTVEGAFVQCNTRADVNVDAIQQALYLVTLSPDVYGLRCAQYAKFEAELLRDEGFARMVAEFEDGLRAGLTGTQLIDPDTNPQYYELAARIRERAFVAAGMNLASGYEADPDKPRHEPPRQGVTPNASVSDWTLPYDVQAYNGARMHYEVAHVAPLAGGNLQVLRRESLGPVPLWRFWDDVTRANLTLQAIGPQSVVLLSGWEDGGRTPTDLLAASVSARLKNGALVVKDISALLDVGCLANASDQALQTLLSSGDILSDLEALLVDFSNHEWQRAWDRVWDWYVDSVMDTALRVTGISEIKCTAKDGDLFRRGNKYVYAVFKGLEVANTVATIWSLYAFNEPYASWDAYVGPHIVGEVHDASAVLDGEALRVRGRVDGFAIASVELRVLDLTSGVRQLDYSEEYQAPFGGFRRSIGFRGVPWLPIFDYDIDARFDASAWDLDRAGASDLAVLICATAPDTSGNPLEECELVNVVVAATSSPPVINSFTAAPERVTAGEASVLSWHVQGSEPLSLTIDRGVGDVTGQSSAEVYPTSGTTYRLTASNPHGVDTRQVIVTVDEASSVGPVARLVTNPAGQVRVDAIVELDATGSTFGNGERSTYEFRSGDGRNRQESWGKWVLSYPTEGTFEPCVRVRNSLHEWSSWACQTLNVVRETAGGPDLTIVQYSIPGSTGPANPSSWEIDHGDTFDLTVAWFNDGDPLPDDHPRFFLQVRANGEVLTGHGYSGGFVGDERTFFELGGDLEPGEYTIVMIIDANNVIEEVDESNNTASFTLHVESVPPSADFSVSTDCLTASFADASTHPMGDARIVRHTWDFRDGNGTTQRHPTHTFSSEGTYNVRLTVEDEWANTDTRTRAVSVEACPDPVEVSISPETVTLPPNTSNTFTATVTGGTNGSVTWSTTCGSISGTGNTVTYTAPTSEGTCRVRATSVEDTDAWDEATVTVEAVGTPEWRASPTQLDFFADVGDPAPPAQSFTLHNDGSVAGSFTLNAGGMAQVSPDTGSIAAGGSQQISVSVEACPDPGTTTSLITLPDTPVTVGVSRTCGEPELDVGMIQVIIGGLPSGVDADVTISGQGWMLWPTSSVLFSDMPPGWYQMTADTVESEGATYEPTPSSESFLVEADATTTVTITYELAAPPAPSRTYRSVAAGGSSSYAIDTDDRVWAWGANRYGQLGDGTTANRLTPTAVSGLGRVDAVAAGSRHALAIVGGQVYAWGENRDGELGTTSVCVGRDCYSAVPVEAGGFTQVIDVAAGAGSSMALRAYGNVFMWGRNYGPEPVMITGISNVTAISAGQNHMLALRSDGTVWSWGSNGAGELGSGDYVDRDTPGQVLDLTNIVAIAAGEAFSMALRSDGSVWAWGYNDLGQLGDGTTTWRTRPVRVSGITTATAITAGGRHGLARLSDGSVRAWGYNNVGQLGDGTTTDRLSPISVSGLHSAAEVAAGSAHSLAVLGNAHAMAWGFNGSGQLGDGTTTSRRLPIAVMD